MNKNPELRRRIEGSAVLVGFTACIPTAPSGFREVSRTACPSRFRLLVRPTTAAALRKRLNRPTFAAP